MHLERSALLRRWPRAKDSLFVPGCNHRTIFTSHTKRFATLASGRWDVMPLPDCRRPWPLVHLARALSGVNKKCTGPFRMHETRLPSRRPAQPKAYGPKAKHPASWAQLVGPIQNVFGRRTSSVGRRASWRKTRCRTLSSVMSCLLCHIRSTERRSPLLPHHCHAFKPPLCI